MKLLELLLNPSTPVDIQKSIFVYNHPERWRMTSEEALQVIALWKRINDSHVNAPWTLTFFMEHDLPIMSEYKEMYFQRLEHAEPSQNKTLTAYLFRHLDALLALCDAKDLEDFMTDHGPWAPFMSANIQQSLVDYFTKNLSSHGDDWGAHTWSVFLHLSPVEGWNALMDDTLCIGKYNTMLDALNLIMHDTTHPCSAQARAWFTASPARLREASPYFHRYDADISSLLTTDMDDRQKIKRIKSMSTSCVSMYDAFISQSTHQEFVTLYQALSEKKSLMEAVMLLWTPESERSSRDYQNIESILKYLDSLRHLTVFWDTLFPQGTSIDDALQYLHILNSEGHTLIQLCESMNMDIPTKIEYFNTLAETIKQQKGQTLTQETPLWI